MSSGKNPWALFRRMALSSLIRGVHARLTGDSGFPSSVELLTCFLAGTGILCDPTHALYSELCTVILKFLCTWSRPFPTHTEAVSKPVEGNEYEKWRPAEELAAVGAQRKGGRTHVDPAFVFVFLLYCFVVT